MQANTKQARQKVVAAIEKVVRAAQELSQAELEFLGAGGKYKSRNVRLVCGVESEALDKVASQTGQGGNG